SPSRLRRLRSHLDARKAPHPICAWREYRLPARKQQRARGRVFPLPLAVSLQRRQHQPLVRSRIFGRNLESLLEALWRTIPALLLELARPHEPSILRAKLTLNRQLARAHLGHQLGVQRIV